MYNKKAIWAFCIIVGSILIERFFLRVNEGHSIHLDILNNSPIVITYLIFIIFIVIGITSLYLSIRSLSEIKRNKTKGKKLSVPAIVLSGLSILLNVFYLLLVWIGENIRIH